MRVLLGSFGDCGISALGVLWCLHLCWGLGGGRAGGSWVRLLAAGWSYRCFELLLGLGAVGCPRGCQLCSVLRCQRCSLLSFRKAFQQDARTRRISAENDATSSSPSGTFSTLMCQDRSKLFEAGTSLLGGRTCMR